jgi:hypothetical protein
MFFMPGLVVVGRIAGEGIISESSGSGSNDDEFVNEVILGQMSKIDQKSAE